MPGYPSDGSVVVAIVTDGHLIGLFNGETQEISSSCNNKPSLVAESRLTEIKEENTTGLVWTCLKNSFTRYTIRCNCKCLCVFRSQETLKPVPSPRTKNTHAKVGVCSFWQGFSLFIYLNKTISSVQVLHENISATLSKGIKLFFDYSLYCSQGQSFTL